MSNAATVGLILCVLVLYKRHALLAGTAAGITLQVAAAVLMMWARISFGVRSFHFTANTTAGGLVTTGAYRWIRHPIYAAVLSFVWAGVLSNHADILALICAAVATGLSAIRIRAEEGFLRKEYADYVVYERTTKRLIPFVF